MAIDRRAFIKAHNTSTLVSKSRADLERLLVRYGCSHFSISNDYEHNRSLVRFTVPRSHASDEPPVEVILPVDVGAVHRAMIEARVIPERSRDELKGKAQAERVAWRNLLVWVDAALSAAALGLQKVDEAFLAHTMIPYGNEKRRAIDLIRDASNGLLLGRGQ